MDEFKKEFDMTSGDGAENSGTENSVTENNNDNSKSEQTAEMCIRDRLHGITNKRKADKFRIYSNDSRQIKTSA